MDFNKRQDSGEIYHTGEGGSAESLSKVINDLRSQIDGLQSELEGFRSSSRVQELSREEVFSANAAALKPVGRGGGGTSSDEAVVTDGDAILIEDEIISKKISVKHSGSFYLSDDVLDGEGEIIPEASGLLSLKDTFEPTGSIGQILVLSAINGDNRIYEHQWPVPGGVVDDVLSLTDTTLPTYDDITGADPVVTGNEKPVLLSQVNGDTIELLPEFDTSVFAVKVNPDAGAPTDQVTVQGRGIRADHLDRDILSYGLHFADVSDVGGTPFDPIEVQLEDSGILPTGVVNSLLSGLALSEGGIHIPLRDMAMDTNGDGKTRRHGGGLSIDEDEGIQIYDFHKAENSGKVFGKDSSGNPVWIATIEVPISGVEVGDVYTVTAVSPEGIPTFNWAPGGLPDPEAGKILVGNATGDAWEKVTLKGSGD